LIQNNMIMTLSDNTRAVNCRLQTEALDAGAGDNTYVVQWSWQCEHQSNFS